MLEEPQLSTRMRLGWELLAMASTFADMWAYKAEAWDAIPYNMALMTERRIRHVPVVNDGKLAAIVSIGDVVKSRIDTLQAEAAQLRDYIQG